MQLGFYIRQDVCLMQQVILTPFVIEFLLLPVSLTVPIASFTAVIISLHKQLIRYWKRTTFIEVNTTSIYTH